MTYEEYQVAVKALEKEYMEKEQAVVREYALSNNPVKIGDVIRDHHCKIKVERISVLRSFSKKPQCVYSGPRLKKNGEPYKNGDTESIWQSNLITDEVQ